MRWWTKSLLLKKMRELLSIGDTVTKEKYELLKSLNLLEDSTFDFALAGGILVVLLLLAYYADSFYESFL